MDIRALLLIVLVLLIVGGLPNWGYQPYGYYPSGAGLVLLIIVLVFILGGRRGRI
jgi:hypothetical protein